MEITLEQVERLREKANVSYAMAKEALEYSGGNLLDALIYLEERGVIPRPDGVYYSSKTEAFSASSAQETLMIDAEKTPPNRPKISLLRRVRYLLLDNELEIWHKKRPITSLPVLILILLLIAAFWFTAALLVLGLFLGFRYRFSGPNLEHESINEVMDSVAGTAADLSRRVMDELRGQHEDRKNDEQ